MNLDVASQNQLIKPLRICLLGYRSHPYGGGQGVYLRYLSKALVDLGHQVDVISGQPYPHLDPGVGLIKMPGMNLYENGLGSIRWRHLLSATDMIEWFSKLTGGFAEPYCFGRRVFNYLIKQGHAKHYDIVHDNQSLSYGVLNLQRHLPLVMTIHHPITSDFRIALEASATAKDKLLTRRWYSFLGMQKKVARGLKHIVTVSKLSQQDIAKDFGIPIERVKVLYNGIDTQVFKPLEAIARLNNRLMATASADQPMKGLAILLKAYKQLIKKYSDLELLVIGKPKEDGDTQKLLEDLDLEERVSFISGIKTRQLVELYAEATLAIVPSLYEGFGLPAGEAMACGVPLISTTGGALPEVVGDAGVLIPPGSVSALYQATDDLLQDAQEQQRLAAIGRAHIQAHFSWRELAKDMSAYYQQVINEHQGLSRSC